MRLVFSFFVAPILFLLMHSTAQADPIDYFYGDDLGNYGDDGSGENPFGLPVLPFQVEPAEGEEEPEWEPEPGIKRIMPRLPFEPSPKDPAEEEAPPTRGPFPEPLPGTPSWITPTYETGGGKIYCLGYQVIEDVYCCVGLFVPGSEYREPTFQEYGLYCGVSVSF